MLIAGLAGNGELVTIGKKLTFFLLKQYKMIDNSINI
jgi:hypothetical protein